MPNNSCTHVTRHILTTQDTQLKMLQSGTIDRVDDIACLVDGFCCWVSHCMEIDIVYIACKCDGQQTNS